MLQGFCIYNMKFDEKANKIVGSLCLTKLVENCPIVLQTQYMKFIWDSIINLIDKKNFSAQSELLNCLISLVLGAEALFTPYANVTLYKVLDFLTDNDWLKRKLALNVIYTLIFYCKEEILPLKDHIVNFLKVLKTDKVKDVREVCILILQIFSDSEPKKKEPVTSSIAKERDKILNQRKSGVGNVSNINKQINESRRDNTKERQNHSKSNSNINTSSKENYVVIKNEKRPQKQDSDYDEELEDFASKRNKTPLKNTKKNSLNKTGEFKEQQDVSAHMETSKPKYVNRKGGAFVNEKMVIKPDPSKSIFKAKPNPAFFNQSKSNQNDIIVLSKGKYQPQTAQTESVNQVGNNNMGQEENEDVIQNSEEEENMQVKNDSEFKQEKITDNNDRNVISAKHSFSNNKNNKMKVRALEDEDNLENKLLEEEEKEEKNKKKLLTNHTEKLLNPTKFDSSSNSRPSPNSTSSVLNSLLQQMSQLSFKQLSLVDLIESIQTDTQTEMEELNNKIENLEEVVEGLKSELFYLKNGEQM